MRNDLLLGALTESIIASFYEVYNEMGYGFREKLHRGALELELRERGHAVAREVEVPVWYKRHNLGVQRVDIVVDQLVVVEVKSSAVLPASAKDQLTNYLRATTLEVGLLLHFGEKPAFFRKVVRRDRLPTGLRPACGSSLIKSDNT